MCRVTKVSVLMRCPNLRREFKELSSDAQQLLTEKLYLENECARLKKRVNSLDEEVRTLRKPPFVVGHVQDILDDRAVVRSSNGTVFMVSVNNRIDDNLIKPGTQSCSESRFIINY